MNVHLIRTDAEYDAYMARVDELMGAEPDTPEAEELELLATLVELYEDEHAPIPSPDPIDAILFCLEQKGRTPADLRDILGVSRGRLSEILNRKRRLSLEMIRTLSRELGIPAEVLIQTKALPGEPAEEAQAPTRVGGGRTPRRKVERSPLRERPERAAFGRTHAPRTEGTLPGVIEAHLRADPNLDSEAADALSQMFQLAYEQFAKRSALDSDRGEGASAPQDSPDASRGGGREGQ